MTRGAGERALRWIALVAWGLAWAWLILGLLVLGEWIPASLLVAALVAVWRVPVPEELARFEAQAAVGAILAGVLWAGGALVGTLQGTSTGSAWPWQAAALLLLAMILAVRERERRVAPWLGVIGWTLGWLVPFVAAGLAAGIGLPLIAPLASVSVPAGILVFPIATVPFAIVAAWSRVLGLVAVALLLAGAVVQTALGPPEPSSRPVSILGPVLFGAGWLLVGATWLRRGREDAVPSA
jgi:hypothetical protein